jgi:CBS domain-containing protein
MSALDLMSARRYRHLPVVDGDKVVGMVSIRDLFNVVKRQLEEDVREREKFIFGSDYGVA